VDGKNTEEKIIAQWSLTL